MAASDKITEWVKKSSPTGEFKRQTSSFRNFIEADPKARFPAEKGRYHLFVSYACPWATRTLIARKLKGLEDFIGVTAVHWNLGEKGWAFASPEDNDASVEFFSPDPLEGHENFTHIRQVYFESDPDYSARFTVPVLYDRKLRTIVNNESSEIVKMFATEFDHLLDEKYRRVELFPDKYAKETERDQDWVYNLINNGVYKAGFATKQDAYDRSVKELFAALDRAEAHLAETGNTFWFGDDITILDLWLFVTLIRFDPVYVQHFKCNIRDIRSGYPSLHRWLRNLYWNVPAFRESTNFEHIKLHYTRSHTQINPLSITPMGPVPDILGLKEEVAAVKAAL